MPTAIEIVELRFCDRIVDVDRRNEQPILLMHLVKPMYAGSRLLGNAPPIFHDLMPAIRILALDFEEQILDHLLFLVC